MVGHTAIESAVIKALEAVDECVGRILKWVDKHDATIMITADHGNSEKLLDEDGKPFTARLIRFALLLTVKKLN